jgi:ABC-2 type transport system permease protein
LRRLFAFVKRDFLCDVSYRFAFIFNVAGIFFSVITFFYISKLFSHSVNPYLNEYGGQYFPFVLIGIAFSGYLSAGLRSFSDALRNEQVMGTLEMILLTPTRLSTMLISQTLWKFLQATMNIFLYLIIGILFLQVNLEMKGMFAAFIILILTVTSSGSLGIIAAAFIMIFKKGDPITWLFITASSLLGGVFYPITVLPEFLQKLAVLLPITHSLKGLRGALLAGHSYIDLSVHMGALVLFTIIFMPLGILTFAYAVKRAKKEGSLVYY